MERLVIFKHVSVTNVEYVILTTLQVLCNLPMTKQARVSVPGMLFQPSVMLVCRVRSLLSSDLKGRLHPYLQTLD